MIREMIEFREMIVLFFFHISSDKNVKCKLAMQFILRKILNILKLSVIYINYFTIHLILIQN